MVAIRRAEPASDSGAAAVLDATPTRGHGRFSLRLVGHMRHLGHFELSSPHNANKSRNKRLRLEPTPRIEHAVPTAVCMAVLIVAKEGYQKGEFRKGGKN